VTTPAAGTAALLKRVRLLELVARRNAAGVLAGDYRTAIRGQGMVFHESRKYVPGEPARRIDWATTARLGEPYVKVHLEERRRQVWIALDVSPSMHSGFQARTKLEYGVELAATLAASASAAGDRLGYVLFADRVLAQSYPRAGKAQLFRLLRALLEHAGAWRRPVTESDPRAAIHALERYRRGRFVVFLISDFIDHDLPQDLHYLRPRHDVSLLHVYDPLEYETSRDVVFPAYAPEGPGRRRGALHPGATGTLDELQRLLRRTCARHRIACASFPTHLPVRIALDRFFHRKRRLAG